ncbi:hypothetical protein Bca101_031740 [Brassica carinata]
MVRPTRPAASWIGRCNSLLGELALANQTSPMGANIPPCLSSDPRIPRGGDCEIVPVLDAMPLSISYEEANAYWSD